jgi:hypothetical protein
MAIVAGNCIVGLAFAARAMSGSENSARFASRARATAGEFT